jgi:hypothetical protein
MTFLTGVFCFALWIPAKSFGFLAFFSILSRSIQGIFWPVSLSYNTSSGKVGDWRWQALGPVATEVVGLKDLPSVLSLAWMSIILPTTCKLASAVP